jgi:hypothetical protein
MIDGDEDDLYNDGLVVLYETSQQFDPESDDFRKMFKTKLIHFYVDYVRYNKSGCRNVKVTTYLEFPPTDFKPSAGEYLNKGVVDKWVESYTHNFEGVDYIRTFFSRLSKEELKLLMELLEPSKRTVKIFDSYEYERVPSSIPLYVVAESLGWTSKKARYCLNKIRHKYIAYSGDARLEELVTAI